MAVSALMLAVLKADYWVGTRADLLAASALMLAVPRVVRRAVLRVVLRVVQKAGSSAGLWVVPRADSWVDLKAGHLADSLDVPKVDQSVDMWVVLTAACLAGSKADL